MKHTLEETKTGSAEVLAKIASARRGLAPLKSAVHKGLFAKVSFR